MLVDMMVGLIVGERQSLAGTASRGTASRGDTSRARGRLSGLRHDTPCARTLFYGWILALSMILVVSTFGYEPVLAKPALPSYAPAHPTESRQHPALRAHLLGEPVLPDTEPLPLRGPLSWDTGSGQTAHLRTEFLTAQADPGTLSGEDPVRTDAKSPSAEATGAVPDLDDLPPFDRALAAYRSGDYETAFRLFRRLANRGDISAMRNVAQMYRKGLGTEQNFKKAREYYAQAGSYGLSTALVNLALMIRDGQGGPASPRDAARMLYHLAKAGNLNAQYLFAEQLEKGHGVTRDLDSARAYYGTAARAGHEAARKALIRLNKARMDPDGANSSGTDRSKTGGTDTQDTPSEPPSTMQQEIDGLNGGTANGGTSPDPDPGAADKDSDEASNLPRGDRKSLYGDMGIDHISPRMRPSQDSQDAIMNR